MKKQPDTKNMLLLAHRINELRKQANDHDQIPHTKLNPHYSKTNPYLTAYREALRELMAAQSRQT